MRIARNHNLGLDEAKNRINAAIGDLERQFSLTSDWQGDRLAFRGAGVDGQVDVSDSSVELQMTLGFALKLMEGSIRRAIEETLDEHID